MYFLGKLFLYNEVGIAFDETKRNFNLTLIVDDAGSGDCFSAL